jgi:ribosomal protein S18 acetylase RimI-like enzyme/DNA-binding HxlR family transcriptional regulator
MDLITHLGELALATRLHRLADLLQKDVTDIYAELGLDFLARWFPVLAGLRLHGSATVTNLADELGLSHQAVSKTVKLLIGKGLVSESADSSDSRKRRLSLTNQGTKLCSQLDGVWEEIRLANRDLLSGTDGDFLEELRGLEAALSHDSMAARVRRRLELAEIDPVQIVDYRPSHKKHFRRLNEIWLDDQFELEDRDHRILDDPNGQILRRGGAVIFAQVDDAVAGTCALIKHRDGTLEMAKMAVDPIYRRRGLGQRLATETIDRARLAGADKLWLRTSPLLESAGRLYRRLGFRRVGRHPFNDDTYGRETFTMVLNLKPLRENPQ